MQVLLITCNQFKLFEIHSNCFKYSILLFQNFLTFFCFAFFFFCTYIRMENSKHSNYKNENIETKYLYNMQKTRFSKVKNSLLELENNFTELKDRKLTKKCRSKN